MNTYTTHYESWLSQLYYYLITSVLVDEQTEGFHAFRMHSHLDLVSTYWWPYYDQGLTARDAVKVFAGRVG